VFDKILLAVVVAGNSKCMGQLEWSLFFFICQENEHILWLEAVWELIEF
jgi:hypothetical protein